MTIRGEDAIPTLSMRVAEHVATIPADAIPQAARHAARRSLLDAVAIMLAASGLARECDPFVELARETGGKPVSTVLGRGFRTGAADAAFANGSMAAAMDFADTHDGVIAHPHAAAVPAALALAEARDATLGELVTAVAIGADLACRVTGAMRGGPFTPGWYLVPVLGAFGAAAAAARLLRLDAERTVQTLSLVMCQATLSSEFQNSGRSDLRAVREGFMARAGLVSAQLAARGLRGFEQVLEGKAGFYALYSPEGWDEAAILDAMGEAWRGSEVGFKFWPTCRGTHSYIEAAISLLREDGLAPETIREVTAVVNDTNLMLIQPLESKRRPQTSIDAKFSLPFTVATALARGDVGLSDFTPERLADPLVLGLADRVVHQYRKRPLSESTRGELIVETESGTLRKTIEVPYGNPARPLSDEVLTAKFVSCASHAPASRDETAWRETARLILEGADDLPVRQIMAGFA